MLELEDEIQILGSFGLTFNEARVFLALTLLGSSSVKEISKFSNVAREAVYRLLPKLQKLGLIEKEIAWPTRFSAITLDDAITVLLGLRNKETRDLQKKAKVLLRLKSKKAKETLEDSRFLLIPARKMLISKIGEELIRAQRYVYIVTSSKRLLGAVDVFSEAIEKALSRGVEFRIVISESNRVLSPVVLGVGDDDARVEVRYASSDLKCAASIVDGKEVLIIIKPSVELCCESPALWSNNISLVSIVEEYFETLWMISQEKPEFSINGDQK